MAGQDYYLAAVVGRQGSGQMAVGGCRSWAEPQLVAGRRSNHHNPALQMAAVVVVEIVVVVGEIVVVVEIVVAVVVEIVVVVVVVDIVVAVVVVAVVDTAVMVGRQSWTLRLVASIVDNHCEGIGCCYYRNSTSLLSVYASSMCLEISIKATSVMAGRLERAIGRFWPAPKIPSAQPRRVETGRLK